jgi:hypothetical protein
MYSYSGRIKKKLSLVFFPDFALLGLEGEKLQTGFILVSKITYIVQVANTLPQDHLVLTQLH